MGYLGKCGKPRGPEVRRVQYGSHLVLARQGFVYPASLLAVWAREPHGSVLALLQLLLGLGLGQILEAVEPKQLEKPSGRAVEDRAARFFGAAGDLDQVLFHQAADRLAARDPADRLDVGAEDRLLVGDDRQRLEG